MNTIAKEYEHVHHRHSNGGAESATNGGIEMSSLDEEVKALVNADSDGDDGNKDSTTHATAAVDSHGMAAGTASNAQVAVNIIISFVGAGLLGVPNAFSQSGWLLGSIALCSVSALNVYAMLLIPQVKRQLTKVRSGNESSIETYGDLGRIILGPRGESFVNLCLVISQVGFATAYIIFIAANLYAIGQIPRYVTCLCCIPGLCGLVQAREMKTLSPFSLLADVANLVGLSAVLLEDWERYTPHNHTIHAVRWEGLLYVIAVTIYSMEGVGLILSLETSCKNPSSFNNLFRLVLTCITLFMSFFGTAGYLGFGDDTMAPITLNLSGSYSATFVKGALCLALYLTYPVMMFPVWSILEEAWPAARDEWRTRVTLRCLLVIGTALVALAVPDFGKFLSLVGSSICTILGFIFPCYFHWTTVPDLNWWQVGLDIGLMAGGAIFGVLGTLQSIQKLLAGEGGE